MKKKACIVDIEKNPEKILKTTASFHFHLIKAQTF
jgi:hypothetical protein